MDETRNIQVKSLHQHIICVLCGGYFVDATTIAECLHSFCRSCIVRYLETSDYCPVCDSHIDKTDHDALIPDRALQNIVYKLVPGLLLRELRQRQLFHSRTQRRPVQDTSNNDVISVVLTFSPNGRPVTVKEHHNERRRRSTARSDEEQRTSTPGSRYLKCPVHVTMKHLKKLITSSLTVPQHAQVDIFTARHVFCDHSTVLDAAHFSLWKMDKSLILYYSVYENRSGIPSTVPRRVRYEQPRDDRPGPTTKTPSVPPMTSPNSRRVQYKLPRDGSTLEVAFNRKWKVQKKTSSETGRVEKKQQQKNSKVPENVNKNSKIEQYFSPSSRTTKNSLNTGFYMRDHQTDANNNNVKETTVTSSPRTGNDVTGTPSEAPVKRKRGRPRKYPLKTPETPRTPDVTVASSRKRPHEACTDNSDTSPRTTETGKQKRKRGTPQRLDGTSDKQVADQINNTFTFKNVYANRSPPTPKSIPVSLPRNLLAVPIKQEKSDVVEVKQEVIPEPEVNKVCVGYPRTSTPTYEHTAVRWTMSPVLGRDLDDKRSGSPGSVDSGYEASLVPRTFNVLQFNSDEESN